MDNITNVRWAAMPENSGLIKPFRMYYVQNYAEKNWDLTMAVDTVSVIIYNKTTDKLIFVKRFRPVAFYDAIRKLESNHNNKSEGVKYPAELGFTLELCMRTVDKNLPLNEIVQEEVERVCGYKISLDRIEQVMMYRSDVGSTGAEETMFYCEVMNEDKIPNVVSADDELEDKVTEIVEMSIEEADQMVTRIVNCNSPPTCLMGVFWFLRNKADAKH